ncbi:MAG TPA: type II toxin-antitoxin system RelE/ParE family toxin [Candidatus Peribacteraceae bacterium]|nr:type II toxin-antitoxin system RelE/ParE family toxin [Candidatus Peribacteraceae bacterium]
MRVEYTSDAQNDIAALDKKAAKRVMDKIDWYASQADPLKFAKRLEDPRKLYRFRIGPYRAIFTLKGQTIVLLVLAVKNRKEAYR